MSIRSYRTAIGIERPAHISAAEGATYVDQWAHAMLSDLWSSINGIAEGGDLNQLTAKARLWFADAWPRAGARERRFPINLVRIQFFDLTDQQGDMVAEVDVLAGTFWMKP
jgi:hypothetical protein